jgi:hypothetical protein
LDAVLVVDPRLGDDCELSLETGVETGCTETELFGDPTGDPYVVGDEDGCAVGLALKEGEVTAE